MEIITIHSYKGGSGKTTVAVNLASQLSTTFGRKVLLIETDFKMPSFSGIFRDIQPKKYLNDFFSDNPTSLENCIEKHGNQLDLIFANPSFDPQDPVHGWDKTWHTSRLKRLREGLIRLKEERKYEYVILDTPPGSHFVVINNIALSSIMVAVVRPNSMAVQGTLQMIESLYYKTKTPSKLTVLLLFNQIPRVPMTKELNEWSETFAKIKVKNVGRIPCSCEGSYAMARGQNIFPRDHEINRYMDPLISTLLKEDVLSIPDPTVLF